MMVTPPWALSNDYREYVTIARHLRFDGVFSMGELRHFGPARPLAAGESPAPTAWRAPLWPWVIATVWTGRPEEPPLATIRFLNAALGAVTVALTAALAGPSAGLLVAVWPLAVSTDLSPLSEPLFTALLVLAVWQWRRSRFGAAGVALGLATLTRSTTWPGLVILLILSAVFASVRARGGHRVAICALLVVTPWTIRNGVVLHQFVPVAVAGSGNNLMLGTFSRPLGSGGNLVMEYADLPAYRDIVSTSDDDAVKEARLQQAGFDRIRQDPLRWVGQRFLEYPRFLLDAGEYWPGADRYPRLTRGLAVTASAALLGLAVLGAGVTHRRDRGGDPLLWVVAYLMLAHFPILSFRRLGAPLVPLFAVLAVSGGRWLRFRLTTVAGS